MTIPKNYVEHAKTMEYLAFADDGCNVVAHLLRAEEDWAGHYAYVASRDGDETGKEFYFPRNVQLHAKLSQIPFGAKIYVELAERGVRNGRPFNTWIVARPEGESALVEARVVAHVAEEADDAPKLPF